MKFLALMVAALLLVSCGTATQPAGGSDPLAGRTFLSTAVSEGGAPRDLVPDTRVRLSFAEGQLTATAGCNTLGGSYGLRDGVLEIGELSMTQMGCPDPLAAQDRWLADVLEGRPAAVVAGDELTLTKDATRIVLLDRRVVDPDRPLVGTEWVVESLVSGEAVSSVPGEARASITFHDDGTVSVQPGCNTGGGRYVVEGTSVTITDLILTRMACVDERGELEKVVLAVLEAPELTVRIEADSLTLMADEKGLQLRAA